MSLLGKALWQCADSVWAYHGGDEAWHARDNRVAIPDAFYKVLLVKIGEGYEGIGFVFENKAGHHALNTYAMSIDEVEALTGYDFFHSLPDRIERMVEAEFHQKVWN